MRAEHHHKPTVTEHLPRRVHTELWCEAEQAIKAAIERLEAMPASTYLTNAVNLLGQAFNCVADYVDEQEAEPVPEGWYRLSLTPLYPERNGHYGYPYDGRYVLISAGKKYGVGGMPFCLAQWSGRYWTPMYGNGEYMGAKFWAPVPGFEGVTSDAR